MQAKPFIFAILLILCLSALPSSVFAASYYASPTGAGSTCTSVAPCSLSSGLSKTAAGDTLYLKGGTYQTQSVNISKSGTNGATITVSGNPGESAVIDGTNTGSGFYDPLVAISGNYITFKDIEVKNAYGMGVRITGSNSTVSNITEHDAEENGILISGNNDTVENSRVYNNCLSNVNASGTRDGYWASGLSAARGPTGATIRGNTVYNTWGEGLSMYGVSNAVVEDNVVYDNWSVNLYIQNTQNTLVQRNLIYRTANSGVGTSGNQNGIVEDNEPADQGYGNSANNTYLNNIIYGTKGNFVHWSSSPAMLNTLIANNTFVNTTGSFANVSLSGTGTNVKFENNIIVQDDSQSIFSGGSGVTMSNNLWSKSPGSSGTNGIVADPKLAKTGSFSSPAWYMLQSSSPAIDKGITVAGVTVDFANNTRIGTPDIGAFEYTGSSSSSTPTPTPSSKPGDFNGDGAVNIFDYNILVANFGHPYTVFDYNTLVANFGT